jgi:YesN/AraC family two-component response regulator
MSRYINMNSSYFSRLFKNQVGISFSEYLIKARVNKATEYLKFTKLSIEEIADLTGFKNVSYFYKTYKKIEKLTPGDVREEYLNKK